MVTTLPAEPLGDQLVRLDDILRDRWLSNAVSDVALQRAMMALLTAGRIRPRALLFTGPPNSGKSALRRKMMMEIAKAGALPGRDRPPVILEIEAPNEAEEARFYEAILESAHRYVPDGAARTLLRAVTALFHDLRPDALIIDEANNLSVFTGVRGVVCLNAIRRLCNVHKIALLCFGTPPARAAFEADEQLENRFEIIELSPLDPPDFIEFVTVLAGAMPLRLRTEWTSAMFDKAYELTGGYVGRAAYLVKEAAVEAVRTGSERINAEIIDEPELATRLGAMNLARRQAGRRSRGPRRR